MKTNAAAKLGIFDDVAWAARIIIIEGPSKRFNIYFPTLKLTETFLEVLGFCPLDYGKLGIH
jgi:hypothetical protein